MHRLADAEHHVALGGLRLAVVPAARQFLNFAGKRAAKGHVQLLNAAADGEHRNAAIDRAADEFEARRITPGIEGAIGVGGLLAIERGVHIAGRARDEQPVHPVENGVNLIAGLEGGHDQGHDAGHLQRGVEILRLRRVPLGTVHLFDIGRDRDDGLRHDGSECDAVLK